MPRIDGFELCRSLRKHERLGKIPIVLLTNSYDDAADQRLAAASGANALIHRTPIATRRLNSCSPVSIIRRRRPCRMTGTSKPDTKKA